MVKDFGPKPLHGYHKKKPQKNMQQFASELEKAVNAGLPSNTRPYDGVFVLATHWSNDKMGVAPLEDDLCRGFDTVYGYTVEKYLIKAMPSEYDTRKAFRKRLEKFTDDYNKSGNLLIVVYSGHAAHVNSSGQYMLAGDLDNQSNLLYPTLDWNQEAAPFITDTVADVLVILDCCYASSSAVENSAGPEVLAASTWHTTEGAALSTSFTQYFINELKRLNGNSASVASIYAQIHRNTKPYTDIGAYPLHIPKIGRDSIILSKLRTPTVRRQSIIGPLQPKDERVVITVHLSDHNGAPRDLTQWTTWLTSNLPSHVSKTQITVEGVFDSDSFVILVSLPLEVWTMLPDGDDAYSFVSFVKSGNLLLPRQATLSLRDMKESLTMSPKDGRSPGGLGGFGGFGGSPGGH